MKRLALALALLACWAMPALAVVNCSSNPFTLTNGQTADATQVMANFNNLLNCANNNLAHNGANGDITSLTGLTTPLAPGSGGTVIFVGGTETGTANAQVVATSTPSGFTLTSGNIVIWLPGHANTGSASLNFGGTGAETVGKLVNGGFGSLAANDLITTEPAIAEFDGTRFLLLNPADRVSLTSSQTLTGGTTTFSATSGINIAGTYTLGTAVPVSMGGTAATALTQFGTMIGEGTGAVHTASPGAAGQLLTSNGIAADPTFQAPKGTLTAGTSNTLNPISATAVTVAHGLSQKPDVLMWWIENVNPECGYIAGQRIAMSMGQATTVTLLPFAVAADLTSTTVTVAGTTFNVLRWDTGVSCSATAANWKLVAVPYKIN